MVASSLLEDGLREAGAVEYRRFELSRWKKENGTRMNRTFQFQVADLRLRWHIPLMLSRQSSV